MAQVLTASLGSSTTGDPERAFLVITSGSNSLTRLLMNGRLPGRGAFDRNW